MDIPGLPARRAALKMLDAVLRRGETLDQAAGAALPQVRGDADRALARAIAAEALRWLADLDMLIDSATQLVLPDDAKPRAVLRLMLAQWLRLETPPHAVIATALPLLAGGPRRLAHGVFSTLVKRAVTLPEAPTLPTEVAARWGDRAARIAAALAEPPPLDITLRDPGETLAWAERLGGKSLLPGHVRLPRGQAVESLPGYREGAWWVQDLAASLPARLLGSGEHGRVLDLCAAPGGKTLQLAAAGARVTALDLSAERMERIRENLARCRLAAETVVADALTWQGPGGWDAVLLDAPCSATGTIRRHPDLPHVRDGSGLKDLFALQSALIDRALVHLRPGGRLVFATCSLLPEEGERQVSAALARHPGVTADRAALALPGVDPGWITAEGGLRLRPDCWPELGGMDGFHIACLRLEDGAAAISR